MDYDINTVPTAQCLMKTGIIFLFVDSDCKTYEFRSVAGGSASSFFHSDVNPDPDPTCQFHADPEPDPTIHCFTDLDPPTKCSRMTLSVLRLPPFHFDADPNPVFTLMRIRIHNTAYLFNSFARMLLLVRLLAKTAGYIEITFSRNNIVEYFHVTYRIIFNSYILRGRNTYGIVFVPDGLDPVRIIIPSASVAELNPDP
jgi:hypothetical protein